MKETTMRILMVLLFVTACSKSEKKSESPCEAAAKRGVETTIAKRRAGNNQPLTPQEQEVPKRLAPALAKTCVDDKWSNEVIECFKTTDDIAKCKEMLTPEQRGAYTRAAISAMQGAGAMGGGMPPHGGGAGTGGMPPHGGGSGAQPPGGGTAEEYPPGGGGKRAPGEPNIMGNPNAPAGSAGTGSAPPSGSGN